MDRKDAQMQKILPALALSFAVQTALAGSVPASTGAETPLAAGLMHAQLVLPAQPAGPQGDAEAPALAADLQAAPTESDARRDQQRRDHTTGMLLAALALMAGIVLRRWGTDRQ